MSTHELAEPIVQKALLQSIAEIALSADVHDPRERTRIANHVSSVLWNYNLRVDHQAAQVLVRVLNTSELWDDDAPELGVTIAQPPAPPVEHAPVDEGEQSCRK
jgi:hypothetical protein